MGATLWRCAPEQVRAATETEVLSATLQLGKAISTPMVDLMKRMKHFIDVQGEGVPDVNDYTALPEQPPPAGQPVPEDFGPPDADDLLPELPLPVPDDRAAAKRDRPRSWSPTERSRRLRDDRGQVARLVEK